jgi:hypothetical protein
MTRLALLAVGLFAFAGCRSQPSSGPSAAGAAGDGGATAGAAGGAGEPTGGSGRVPATGWEPVRGQPAVSGARSCGPGCRLALARPVAHDSSHGHGFSTSLVVDTSPDELFYASLGSNRTTVLRGPAALAAASGSLISYAALAGFPAGDVMVVDTASGMQKSYLHFEDVAEVGDLLGTFISDEYVFWSTTRGTTRANLETSEITKSFATSLLCDGSCMLGGELLCANASRLILRRARTCPLRCARACARPPARRGGGGRLLAARTHVGSSRRHTDEHCQSLGVVVLAPSFSARRAAELRERTHAPRQRECFKSIYGGALSRSLRLGGCRFGSWHRGRDADSVRDGERWSRSRAARRRARHASRPTTGRSPGRSSGDAGACRPAARRPR